MTKFAGLFLWVFKSAWHRRATYFWAVASFSISSALIFFSFQFKNSIERSLSGGSGGVDLIVGAKTSEFNLVMFSLFHLGQLTSNLSLSDFEDLKSQEDVDWAIPIAKGDSVQSYPVVGTNHDFFDFYRYDSKKSLELARGAWFSDEVEVVLGAEVAKSLGLTLGEEVIISHGLGAQSVEDHHDHPYQIVGVLSPTGTAVDRSLFVDFRSLADLHGQDFSEPSISAVLLKLKSRAAILGFRNQINSDVSKHWIAAMPGQVLQEFWRNFRFLPQAVHALALLVLALSLLSFFSLLMLLVELRRKEIAVLKSLGFGRGALMLFFAGESSLICLIGGVMGWVLQLIFFFGLLAWAKTEWGFVISHEFSFSLDAMILLFIVGLGAVCGWIPFVFGFRRSVAIELQSPS
jgi:putative ABC transport system permease protein